MLVALRAVRAPLPGGERLGATRGKAGAGSACGRPSRGDGDELRARRTGWHGTDRPEPQARGTRSGCARRRLDARTGARVARPVARDAARWLPRRRGPGTV